MPQCECDPWMFGSQGEECRTEKRIGPSRKDGQMRKEALLHHRLFFALEMFLLRIPLDETRAELARKVFQIRDARISLLQVGEYDGKFGQTFDALVINLPREILPEWSLLRPRKCRIHDGADEDESCHRPVERL